MKHRFFSQDAGGSNCRVQAQCWGAGGRGGLPALSSAPPPCPHSCSPCPVTNVCLFTSSALPLWQLSFCSRKLPHRCWWPWVNVQGAAAAFVPASCWLLCKMFDVAVHYSKARVCSCVGCCTSLGHWLRCFFCGMPDLFSDLSCFSKVLLYETPYKNVLCLLLP